jgi:hypothetical protein
MTFSSKQISALRTDVDPAFTRLRKLNDGRELPYIEGWYAIAEANGSSDSTPGRVRPWTSNACRRVKSAGLFRFFIWQRSALRSVQETTKRSARAMEQVLQRATRSEMHMKRR